MQMICSYHLICHFIVFSLSELKILSVWKKPNNFLYRISVFLFRTLIFDSE